MLDVHMSEVKLKAETFWVTTVVEQNPKKMKNEIQVTVLLRRPTASPAWLTSSLNFHPIYFCLLNVFLIYHKAQKKVSDEIVCKYWWVLQNIHIGN